MSLGTAALLGIAALLAGAINSVAGGGSFLTFPALIFAGAGPIHANATSTVALWPGSLASAVAYRRELSADRAVAWSLTATSLVGGGVGALLLVYTPPDLFMRMVPWLLLLATALFSAGPRLFRRAARAPSAAVQTRPVLAAALQLPIAVYGGYFGGGIGMMMLAALTLLGMSDIHRMNALKVLLAAAINGVAVVTFVAAGVVDWPAAIAMLIAGSAGGYLGAAIARRLAPRHVRVFVILVGWSMTAYFFLHH